MRNRLFAVLVLFVGSAWSLNAVSQQIAAQALEPDHPVRVSGGVIAGNILTKVMPKYPEAAKAKHVGGTVVMRVIIGKDGLVKSAEAISGADLLRQAYVDAVKQWTYKPYLLNGNPVEVETTVTMSIQLNGGPDASVPPQPNYAPVELLSLVPGLTVPDDPSLPVRVPGGIVASALVRKTSPFIPEDGNCHHSGTILTQAIIGRNGHIKRLRAISGTNELQQPAVDAIWQWVYRPFRLQGQQVEIDTTISLTIDLNGDGCR